MKNLLRKILDDPSFPRRRERRRSRKKALCHVVFFTPDGNRELLPVYSEKHWELLEYLGYKPGESFRDATKRNYKRHPADGFLGSVRFYGR